MGLLDWLRRRLRGDAAPATPPAAVPAPPIRRDRDELTMFINPAGQDDSDAPTGQDDSDAPLHLEVPRRVVATLEAIHGELLGEKYELREGENQLGRSPAADVVLPSMWISRTHAMVKCEAGRIEITSLSDKITSVEGEPVADAVELTEGTSLQLGGTIFRLELEG